MKIAYILKMYPRFSETFIVNEILELERRGVDVRVYSLRKPDDGRFHAALANVQAQVIYVPNYPQLQVERIERAHRRLQQRCPASYAQVRDYTLQRGHDAAIKRFLQAGYVAAHLLDNPVDGIHAHFATSATRVANLVWRLIGTPYSVTAHAKDIFHESVSRESLGSKLGDARFVVTVSRYNERYLRQMLAGRPADIRVLYNGIDTRTFRPPTRPVTRPRILAVGRLVEKKGFHHLIDACKLLDAQGRQFECQIIGKGEWEGRLQSQIDQLGLNKRVKLLGARPQHKVRDAYRRAAIFALPCVIGSDGNRDGLPTVMLEAMACGLPVVTTPVTGNPEIVSDTVEGLIVPSGDPHALADALGRLLDDPERRHKMALAARAKVLELFDVRQNVATLRDWLAAPAPAPPVEPVMAGPFPPLPELPLPTLAGTLATVTAR